MANINSNPKEIVCEDVKPIRDSVRQRALANTVPKLRWGEGVIKGGEFLVGLSNYQLHGYNYVTLDRI